jgi:hypothetical protein
VTPGHLIYPTRGHRHRPHQMLPIHLPDPAEEMPLWVSIDRGALVAHDAESDCLLAVLSGAAWETSGKRPVHVGPDLPAPKVHTQAEGQRLAWAKHVRVMQGLS